MKYLKTFESLKKKEGDFYELISNIEYRELILNK